MKLILCDNITWCSFNGLNLALTFYVQLHSMLLGLSVTMNAPWLVTWELTGRLLEYCIQSLPHSTSSDALCWRTSWWTWWFTPWSGPRRRRSLTTVGPASSSGSISRASSFSLCFSSLQVSHIWSFLFIRRWVYTLFQSHFTCWWVYFRWVYLVKHKFRALISLLFSALVSSSLFTFLSLLKLDSFIYSTYSQCQDQEITKWKGTNIVPSKSSLLVRRCRYKQLDYNNNGNMFPCNRNEREKSLLKTPKNGFIKGGLKLLLERQVEICQGEKIGKCYHGNKMII